jgi:hypothetical protein
MHEKFWLETVTGRDHSEDIDTNGSIVLNCVQDSADWIHLAQENAFI